MNLYKKTINPTLLTDAMHNAPTSAALLIDHDACWLSAAVDEDVALTLIAVASEDPASWDKITGYWPRFRSPQVYRDLTSRVADFRSRIDEQVRTASDYPF